MKKLLLLGGGHAHVEVLRQFGLRRMPGVAITLVSPDRHTLYSGMLPGLVAGHYTLDECRIDLQRLAAYAGAQLLLAQACALDAQLRMVTLSNGATLTYDMLSINTGATPLVEGIAGVQEHAITIKPVAAFLAQWTTLIERVRTGEARSIAVVGGGAAGVEVLLAMQHFFAHQSPRHDITYRLITDAPHLLAQHPPSVRTTLMHNLARKKIHLHTALRVTRIEAQTLIARDAQRREQAIAADAIVWITGAAPPLWLATSGLALSEDKFINENKYLQSTTQGDIFAAGDCATVAGVTYPKSGVYAVRQGPVLAHNLRAALTDAALRAYTPQSRALALISTGEQHAIASWGPLAFHGHWVWQWKNRIDRRFIKQYRDLDANP